MEDIREKLGELNAKAKAAHERIDRLEEEIKEDLTEIIKDLKELNAYMNRGKGWAASMLLLAGISGAGLTKLIAVLFNK